MEPEETATGNGMPIDRILDPAFRGAVRAREQRQRGCHIFPESETGMEALAVLAHGLRATSCPK